MPDTQTPGATQADTSGDTSAQAATQTTSEPQAGDDQQISLEEAKKLRSEAASLRKRMKAFEDAQAAADQAKLTDQERLQKQLADTQAALNEKELAIQDRVIRYEVQLQAAELGANPRHLDKIARLIDRSDLEFDDDGMPKNVKVLLEKLFKEMPELLLQDKRTPTSGGATNPGRAASSSTGLSWDVISKMTSEQYNARRAEIVEWMQKNPPKRF